MKKKDAQSLTSEDALDLLVELRGSKFWPAILMFNRARYSEIGQSLFSTDPFKFPTEVARSQGQAVGIFYQENLINNEFERRNKEEKGAEEQDDTLGAYNM